MYLEKFRSNLINWINWPYILIIIQVLGLFYLGYNILYHPEKQTLTSFILGALGGLSYSILNKY